MRIARACLGLLLASAAGCGAPATRPLVVAAAASTRPALDALAAAFRAAGGAVEIVYGASGQLVAQIEQGARFHVFLGADVDHAARLVQLGRAASTFEYGRGQLALWVRDSSPLHPERDGLAVLEGVKKIAVANPRLAPYGAAALACLDATGRRARAEPRLVFAENVAQALHFAASGAADVAFVATSLVTGRAETGGRFGAVAVPSTVSLVHGGAILTSPDEAEGARAFVAFVLGAPGRNLLAAHGLAAPD